MHHHFWFLETAVSGMPLQTLCKLALAAVLPAALLPGLVRSGGSKLHLGVLLIAQARLLNPKHLLSPKPWTITSWRASSTHILSGVARLRRIF